MLEEAVHLTGGDALATLGGNLFENRENFIGALSLCGGNQKQRCIIQELERIAQALLIGLSVSGFFGILQPRRTGARFVSTILRGGSGD